MTAVASVWRAHRRRSRRAVWVGALTIGLLVGVAFASLAGARQTASTFAAYERDVRLSDLAVNTFVPDLARVRAIARLPGVRSSATYLGLEAYPVVHGEVVRDFRYTGVFGSLDGRFFSQDRATVIHGRLPRESSTHELALSQKLATRFRVGVGDDLTYRFEHQSKLVGQSVFRVVGIVRLPPVIVDENDVIDGAVLPPAATRAHLDSFYYAWQGIRLDDGVGGIDRFLDHLRTDRTVNSLPPVTQRYDQTRVQAQRSIRPEAIALALFGLAAAIAALALGGLAVSRLVGRRAGDRHVLSAVGFTRRQLWLIFGLDAVLAVALGLALAVVVAVALSPVWPVGTVRVIAPATGIRVDLTVVVAVGGVLAFGLLGIVTVAAWRAAGGRSSRPPRARTSVVMTRVSRRGVPVPGVLGAHFALDREGSRQSLPVGATLFAGTAATLAVVAALVFGASLQSLVSHPVQYGWDWDRMMIAEAGYGNLKPSIMQSLIDREHSVTGWSLLTFGTARIDGTSVPVLGIDRREGRVQPPVVRGRAVSGDHDIAFGETTLAGLGRRIGDRVRVAVGTRSSEFTIVGTATLPSVGMGGADHPSLGRGTLLTFASLANLVAPGQPCESTQAALCPSVIVFDAASATDGAAVVRHLAAADPDGTRGGTYEQPVTLAADIRNYREMGSFPVVLAALLASAAAIGFVVTLLASVRGRRRDLAILKTLGLRNGQLRATLVAQSLLTIGIALVIGAPFGIMVGRLTWIRFAHDTGVIARPVAPLLTMVGMAAAVTIVCGLFALIPAAIAARAPAARVLRAE